MATLVYYVDNNNGETNFVGLWASRKEAIEVLKNDSRYGNPDGTNFFQLLKKEPNDEIGFIDFDWPVKLEDLYNEVLWKIMAAQIEPFDWPNRWRRK